MPMEHNARVLAVRDKAEITEEMDLIGAEPGGIARMLPKAQMYLLKLQRVRIPMAHILKESFLSAGGDAAVSRDVITGRTTHTDVLLIGSLKQYRSVIEALNAQKFGGAELAAEIEAAISNFDSRPSPLPSDMPAGDRARRLFQAMSERTLVMGILNVTPDSFADGGRYTDVDTAANHAFQMIEDGADIIDVGGESARPGSEPVPADEELRRVLPVIEHIRSKSDILISIDTYKAEIARACLDAGADMVNDISGMSFDPEIRTLVAERHAPAILMHIKGTPKDMQVNPTYDDLMSEIVAELRMRIAEAVEAGVDERLLMVDPGFGFGKTPEHNLTILRRLREFANLGRQIVIGTSRKSTIGKVLGDLPPEERLEGTAATVAAAVMNGANIVRVHDVKEMTRVIRMTEAIRG